MVQASNFVVIVRAWRPSPGNIVNKASLLRQSTTKPQELEKTNNQASIPPRSMLAPNPSGPCPTRFDFSKLETFFLSAGAPSRPQLWYILATAALLAFHQATLIGELWRYVSQQLRAETEQLAVVRQIREACLKSSVLVGFPRAINGLSVLQKSIEAHSPHLASLLASDTSLRASVSPQEQYSRGKAFFTHLYAQHTDHILASMAATSGGDLDHFAISSIYGELLAETSIIDAQDTVLLELVCCLADGVAPQAKGHFYGSKNFGATNEIIRSAVLLTANVASQLGVSCEWPREEYRFLDIIMT